MKFKKSVSALAALTLSVTAFAGLAVTANAADYTVDQVLYGVNTDGVISAQTDFTDDTNETTDVNKTFANIDFLSGSALDASKGAISKSFSEPITSGKVHFAASYTVVGGKTSLVKLVDSTGATVVGLYPVDNRNSGTMNVVSVGDKFVSNYIYTPRSVAYKLNDLTIDLDSKTYSYNMTLCTSGSSGTVKKVETVSGNGSLSGVSDIAGLSIAKDAYLVDNLYLYNEKSANALYSYTVNYTLGTDVVHKDEAKVAAGTVITADTVVYTEDGRKCFITADEAPTLTVTADGENVLNVPVRLANTYTAKVVANVNGTEKELSSTDVVEGENWSYTFPMYYQDGTTVYEAGNNSDVFYGGSVTNVTQDQNIPVYYTKATYENVVLCEDLDGSTGNYANTRASNGSAYDNTAYTSSTIIEPGTYDIYVRLLNRGRGSSLTIGDQTVFDYTSYNEDKKNAWLNVTIPDFTVTEAAPIVLNAGSSKTYDQIDTILVVKKADPIVAPKAEVETVGDLQTTGTGYSAQAYKATFTLNGYTAEKLTWSVNPTEDVEAEAQKIEQDLSSLSGESEYVVGLVVNAADFSKVKGVTATIE